MSLFSKLAISGKIGSDKIKRGDEMKPWLKVLITVIITSGIVGGVTYYFLNKKATADKNNLQSQIDDLNKKLTTTNAALTAAQKTTTSTQTPTATDPTADWKTYTSTTYGFSVKYPTNWTATDGVNSLPNDPVVNLVSPETTALVAAQVAKTNGENYGPLAANDLYVSYFSDIADETESKANKVVPKNLEELAISPSTHTKAGDTNLDGEKAVKVITGGMSEYYTIFALHNNHLYELFFSNVTKEANLSTTEKQIIGTFKFTK